MDRKRGARVTAAEQHFACTLCGKCCYGWLPLTLDDAFANAGRFPLAMIWTTVQQTHRAFALTERLGTSLLLPKRKGTAVLVTPTAYLPPSFPCPALAPDNRCAIQEEKPLRCRSMPFYPYREESDQADLLLPRKGWDCDVSESAPLVYHDRRILDREAFDRERTALLDQAETLRGYADTTLKHHPAVMSRLTRAAQNPTGGRLVIGFGSFLRHDRNRDPIAFAKAQRPVLLDFAERTAGARPLADYHGYYNESAAELAWYAQRAE